MKTISVAEWYLTAISRGYRPSRAVLELINQWFLNQHKKSLCLKK